MSTHANRVQMTVTGTPGTGTITLNAASSGYQTLGAAYAGNATVDILITEGTAWEVARNCTYTHSGTTVSRGTLEASSTGSAISLTSAAVVSVIATADAGRRWDAAALEHVAGTDADTTMAVNSLYVVDMSAWATANRNYTLPATAAVGDRCGVMVSASDASHELILKANTGDTLNGVTAAEWSRLFITGEVVIMRCVTANAAWIVEYDGRIPQLGMMSRTTSDTTTSSTGWTSTTLTTIDLERGCVASTAGVGTLTWRRTSYVLAAISWQAKSGGTCADNEQLGPGLSYGGAVGVGTLVFSYTPNHAGTATKPIASTGIGVIEIPEGSVLEMSQYAAATSNLGARASNSGCFMRLLEILK